ncbi:NAD(P)H-binding protein [Luteipulveratus sp. YIM 133132]|uniref:NAD(P)-dependent oxidoreductase n=1 Tax=Luteipulveratus flavus TaxID=3031728 RepID=UPI0023AEA697|nr:NAD(P)H-binding protein [Luteipulveratus sp. YIM 133132]MDE9367025.1 NAD(P)H-binding protein [Luteipulveratus sp. YIM 133132]
MRITVFGASSPTGRHLTDQALAAGHDLVAVSRRPDAIAVRPGLTTAQADIADPDAVADAVEGADAVVSILGVPFSRQPISVYSQGVTTIAAAMHRHGIKRLVAVSSNVQKPGYRPAGAFFFNNVLEPLVIRRLGRTLYDDMHRMEAILSASDLHWTAVRSSGLFDADGPTSYEIDGADGMFTARTDLAAALLSAVTDDGTIGRAVSVTTTDPAPGIVRLLWREAITKK